MRNNGRFKFVHALLALILIPVTGCQPPATVRPAAVANWDDPSLWTVNAEGKSSLVLDSIPAMTGRGIIANYKLIGDFSYVELKHTLARSPSLEEPVAFYIKAAGTGNLEIKFTDADGSVYGRKVPMSDVGRDWTLYVVHTNHVEYWWGGDRVFNGLTELGLAISGQGEGTVWFDEIGLAEPGQESTLVPFGALLDSNRELPGIGSEQRRAAELIPEDPLVLEWMKQVQDTTTPSKQLLGSMEDQQLQTFNNALAAMAFILKNEKERAERILDFFAQATDRTNTDQSLQNFFFNGEARGFYQFAVCTEEDGKNIVRGEPNSDRWMGDLFWLLLSYHYYDQAYGPGRYNEIEKLLSDLLDSWYRDDPEGNGGYVQHGWRRGDKQLHEDSGHHEGNIDAYAYYYLSGNKARAGQIREWLEVSLAGNNSLPLDLYTWRVLAYGKEAADLLNIPDYDLRYRKIVSVNGRDVTGVWHGADGNIRSNIWIDGVGHMACAYYAAGNEERADFYANQMDLLLMDREISGVMTRGIPYTVIHEGGYDWVALDRGFLSTAAWYIFAKNRFNPMTLKKAEK